MVAGRQLAPGAAEAGGARHPHDHLQVAQAARALLAVGLQRIRRVLVLHVALAHLERLRAQEGLRVDRLGGGLAELLEQPARSAQEARLQQRRLHGDVAPGLGHALAHGAHRRADLQADVPAGGDETLERRAQGVVVVQRVFIGHQHQHVDVGIGEQLGAPVAAHGHQRGARRHGRMQPQVGEGGIDMACQRLHQAAGGGGGGARLAEALDQCRLAVSELLAQAADRVGCRSRCRGAGGG